MSEEYNTEQEEGEQEEEKEVRSGNKYVISVRDGYFMILLDGAVRKVNGDIGKNARTVEVEYTIDNGEYDIKLK